MNWKKGLTPKDTEEIKPNLFIKTIYQDDKGVKKIIGYRQIEPLFWNGKFRKKEQLASIFSWRTIITLGLILFIVWAYLHDVRTFRNFYIRVVNNPVEFCESVYTDDKMMEGLDARGLDTDSLQGYS